MCRALATLVMLPVAGLVLAGAALVPSGDRVRVADGPTGPTDPAVSVPDCAGTGGMALPDGEERYWCVGGVYTGERLG